MYSSLQKLAAFDPFTVSPFLFDEVIVYRGYIPVIVATYINSKQNLIASDFYLFMK